MFIFLPVYSGIKHPMWKVLIQSADLLGTNRETSVKCLKGIRVCSSKKASRSIAQLKCLYTNAHSMGNKQEELEATVQLESYVLIGIAETWWDESHDWSAALDGYNPFRRDRQERRGGGVALYTGVGSRPGVPEPV